MTENVSGGVAGGSGAQWKSRFPVARIKKIMQADEDVGKVAQVTPVAISKALELFMDRIIKAVADETKARGAKRVTPSHFKQIISTQKQYDFLESLTAEIPLPPSRPPTPPPPSATSGHPTRRRRKASPSTDSQPQEAAAPKRKRRSPHKDTVMHEDSSMPPESIPPELSTEIKTEVETQAETQDEMQVEMKSESDHHPDEEKHRRGWFDIVMRSDDDDPSDDESQRKRRRNVKDEDEDYVP